MSRKKKQQQIIDLVLTLNTKEKINFKSPEASFDDAAKKIRDQGGVDILTTSVTLLNATQSRRRFIPYHAITSIDEIKLHVEIEDEDAKEKD